MRLSSYLSHRCFLHCLLISNGWEQMCVSLRDAEVFKKTQNHDKTEVTLMRCLVHHETPKFHFEPKGWKDPWSVLVEHLSMIHFNPTWSSLLFVHLFVHSFLYFVVQHLLSTHAVLCAVLQHLETHWSSALSTWLLSTRLCIILGSVHLVSEDALQHLMTY